MNNGNHKPWDYYFSSVTKTKHDLKVINHFIYYFPQENRTKDAAIKDNSIEMIQREMKYDCVLNCHSS